MTKLPLCSLEKTELADARDTANPVWPTLLGEQAS